MDSFKKMRDKGLNKYVFNFSYSYMHIFPIVVWQLKKKENFEKKVFLSLSILLEFNIPNEAYIVIGS